VSIFAERTFKGGPVGLVLERQSLDRGFLIVLLVWFVPEGLLKVITQGG